MDNLSFSYVMATMNVIFQEIADHDDDFRGILNA